MGFGMHKESHPCFYKGIIIIHQCPNVNGGSLKPAVEIGMYV